MTRRKQSGSIVTLVLLGLLAAGVLATIAYGSYFQIARGVQDTVLKANASALLTQAAYALAAEAGDTDGDGIAEPPAATGTWQIPISSGAPKADAWGTAFLYCPWDNGAVNASASTERINGVNPAQQSSIQFALVSAGPDKVFTTDCTQAKTGLPAVGSDDGVRTRTVAQIAQGVGGTYFYGDPVDNEAALPRPPDYSPPAGMIRLAKDTNISYSWNGGAWVQLTAVVPLAGSLGADCSSYPPGALVRDASDNLYMCGSAGSWIKFAKAP